MKRAFKLSVMLVASLAFAALAAPALAAPTKGVAVAYPWAFTKGTDTARSTALSSVEEVAGKRGFAQAPRQTAKSAWASQNAAKPTPQALKAFAVKMKASVVLYGSVTWHTRSVWVGASPKTISTATVDACVYDVRKGKVVYSKKKVEARSDEPAAKVKALEGVLVTPFVTDTGGASATPREQRAAQLALARAYQAWVKAPK